jgi:hypothetical protein
MTFWAFTREFPLLILFICVYPVHLWFNINWGLGLAGQNVRST